MFHSETDPDTGPQRPDTIWPMGVNCRKQSEGAEMGRLDCEVELGTKDRRNCDRV